MVLWNFGLKMTENSFRSKREFSDMILDVLKSINEEREGILKTNLLYKCRLSPQGYNFFFNLLLNNKLITYKERIKRKGLKEKLQLCILLTKKGKEFFYNYSKAYNTLKRLEGENLE